MIIRLTWYEDILIWGADELHCLLREDRHVLISCIARNVFICAVVQGDENVQQN